MSTGVLQIELKDGRLFRVSYSNSNQEKRLYIHLNSIKNKIEIVKTITRGVHTVKEFEQHLKTI